MTIDALHAVAGAVEALAGWLDGQLPDGVAIHLRELPSEARTPFVFLAEGDGGGLAGEMMAGDSTNVVHLTVICAGTTAGQTIALSDLVHYRLMGRDEHGTWLHMPSVGAGLRLINRTGSRGPFDQAGGIPQRSGAYTLTLHRS